MRITPKIWRILGIGLAVLLVAGLVVRTWVVPGMIARQIEARYAGKVSVGGWWIGGSSSGITNLSLHEGPGADSPVWATAEAIQTDVSLGGLLSGRVMPGKITLRSPTITFRLDADGLPLTRPPLKGGSASGNGGGGGGPLPKIVVEDARVTIDQKGRKPMVVTRVGGELASADGGERLTAKADDPTWGHWEVNGKFDPGFQDGEVHLASTGVEANAEKVASIPFVPREVWDNIVPSGPADVRLDVGIRMASKSPVTFHAELDLKKTTAQVRGLDLVATDATGQVLIDGGLVKVKDLRGRAIGGRVAAPRGTLDFTKAAPTFDLRLDLDGINIADAPPKWQLGEVGMTTGRLTGHADLKAVLAGGGIDLTGSHGEAEITGGTLQGIPIRSLTLAMTAQGDDLQYRSKTDAALTDPGESRPRPSPVGWASSVPTTDRVMAGGAELAHPTNSTEARTRRALGPNRAARIIRVADQSPGPPKAKARASVKSNDPPAPKTGLIKLPRSISTQIELEHVDLKALVTRVEALGIRVPVPVAGKLSLKAEATIPLGNLRDVKDYTFRGDATLSGASIDGVDLGIVQARLDLAEGVLELTDFRGRLVNLPDGGLAGKRPEPAAPVPARGPLPPGGFRGHLRAEVSPKGRLQAHFEGNALPVGELAAPALPRPTPVSGNLTFDFDAEADINNIADPKSWTATGHARSETVSYLESTLDDASLSFALKQGRLDVPDLAARLGGKPLSIGLSTNLAAPYAFDARLDVVDWDLSDALTLVPGAPKPAPADGLLSAHASARGTLSPRDIQTSGHGRIGRFRAEAVPLGDVPFDWKTEGETIRFVIADARPFGGRLSAEATVPAKGEGPSRGTVRVSGIDTAQMASQVPGGTLKLTGKADGTLAFLVPAHPSQAANAVVANLTLSAPDLTVQGLPAEHVAAAIWARKGVVHYEVTADSLGGKVKVQGDVPLALRPGPSPAPAGAALVAPRRPPPQLGGELRAVGFRLGEMWEGLGLAHALGPLDGEGAIDANVRVPVERPGVFARGLAEVRDLRWQKIPVGRVKAAISLTPSLWRIDPISGELLGGVARGRAWGEESSGAAMRSGFALDVQEIDLRRATAFLPSVARHVTGFGSLRTAGRLDGEGVHADGEIAVAQARVFGLPLNELRLPVEVALAPASGEGHLNVHRGSARISGGRVEGDARFRLGVDRAFSGSLRLTAIDLETITRAETDTRRPASGKVSGTASWSGRDPLRRRGLRGRIDLDLDDASLFELPVFKELSRFFGAAQGGVFEDGDLHATIGERELIVEQFTLDGRLAQMHATGTIGYDTSLNLEVLVNTNQVIPETGQALVRLIPGLGEAAGRRDQAVSRVGSFLSNRLLKFRVTGTLRAPQVNADATVVVGEAAVGFFGGVLKLPLGLLR